MPTDRQFTGQRLEPGRGLYDYKARYYDPGIGRFVQPDTVVPRPGDPQSLNRYSYVNENPLRYADPSGRWAFEEDPYTPGRLYPPTAYAPAHRKVGYDFYSDKEVSAGEMARVATLPFQAAAATVAFEGVIADVAIPALSSGAQRAIGTLGLICTGGGCAGIRNVWNSLSNAASDIAVRGYIRLAKGNEWSAYYESFVKDTARLRISLRGGRVLYRVANSEAAAKFGEYASVERPSSPVEAILKNALHPSVTANRARFLYQVVTKPGLYVEGIAASQESFPGGYTQIFKARMFGWSPWKIVKYIGY